MEEPSSPARPAWATGPDTFAEPHLSVGAGVDGIAPARRRPGTELWYYQSGLEQMQKIERREPFSRCGLIGGQMGDGFVLSRTPGQPAYEANATHEAELEVAAGALDFAKQIRMNGVWYSIAWGAFLATEHVRLLRYYPLGTREATP